MSLYKKHRPTTFNEVRGNKEVLEPLQKMLTEPNKMPHTFLLHGSTGCGKTTIGRIIKNELNISDNDYREINSSEMRGIDTVRDIIKNCQYSPLDSKYRIYLIDECHKLTNDAQNAFLKILEDTPEHVIFILCTTDPEKLIKAILSRCQQFQLKPLENREMVKFLRIIVRKEGEKLDIEVLSNIAEKSEGRPREALQMLERLLSVEPENRKDVADQIQVESAAGIDLCRALIKRNSTNVRTILADLKTQEPESIRRMVMGYASAILLKSNNDVAFLILEEFVEPFYNSGFPGLVYACYAVLNN